MQGENFRPYKRLITPFPPLCACLARDLTRVSIWFHPFAFITSLLILALDYCVSIQSMDFLQQMPYMSVYGAFNGDTTVGGKNADPNVMADLGVSCQHWRTNRRLPYFGQWSGVHAGATLSATAEYVWLAPLWGIWKYTDISDLEMYFAETLTFYFEWPIWVEIHYLYLCNYLSIQAKFATIGQVYKTPMTTLLVLNRLELRGWRVISTNSVPSKSESVFVLLKRVN